MSKLSFTTESGLTYEQDGDVIRIRSNFGGYNQIGEQNYYYYADNIIALEDMLEFENKVRELLWLAEKFTLEVN